MTSATGIPAETAAGENAADVAARLERVRDRVAAAAARAGRPADAVTLVAVSKAFPAAAVLAAQAAGQVDFGESRVQELQAKVDALGAAGAGARWHFVGRLQRNKVRVVVGLADLVHSVDRLDLAAEIARRARAAGRVQAVLLQVNVDDDPAKGGCAPMDAPALAARLAALDGLVCTGLMTMPALGGDPRRGFARLRALRDALQPDHPALVELSMGMSADFEAAIEAGATLVRVGEAIFGRRPPAPDPRG